MSPAAFTNGYNAIQFANFSGGLNLRDKADAVGDTEAIDLLNVNFNERGAIKQRDGYADLGATDLTNRVDSLSPFYTAAGARFLIAGCGTRLEALNTAGAVVTSLTGLAGGPWTFARFADPAHEYVYAANGADTLRRFDGTAWAAPTATVNGAAAGAMPKAGSICVSAAAAGSTASTNASNRLVATAFGVQTAAGPGGTPTNPSRVYFSNPGQPEVWETSGAQITPPPTSGPLIYGRNYVDLTPGDGEQIMAAITWRELVFVFKETKFFVFWGESAAADGTPVFQFREVVNGVGLSSKLGVYAGRDGVYFFNRRGVYRTTGQEPQLLSDILMPLWIGDPEVYYQGKPINMAALGAVRMAWLMEQLFVAIPTGSSTTNDRLLCFDGQHGWWTIHDIAASALAPFRRADQSELHHGYAVGPQRIGHRNFGSTTDRGNTITSRWRSGWGDHGVGQNKTIRETKVWGSGAVITSFSTDFATQQRADLNTIFTPVGPDWVYRTLTANGGSFAALSTAYANYAALAASTRIEPVVENALVRYAVRGTVFSTQFANSPSSPFWTVHRVSRHLREIREPSIR